MHYFGAMTDWKKLNSFSLSLLAGICLIAAWTWSPLVVLLFPAWVMLLELAGRKKRPLLFLYLAFAIWNVTLLFIAACLVVERRHNEARTRPYHKGLR